MPPEFISAYTVIGLSLLVMAVVIIFLAVIQTRATVEAINRKLELLMKHSGMNVHEIAVRVVQAELREGETIDKIKAIMRYQQLTGANLAEAKAAVEKIQEGAGQA